MADSTLHSAAQLAKLRELCYLRPAEASSLAGRLAAEGGPLAAEGWLHVALGATRGGPSEESESALQQARRLFEDRGDATGLAWCDEVQAMAFLHRRDFTAASRLHTEIDSRSGIDREPLYRFVAHNARANRNRLSGNSEAALRHFCLSHEAAVETGLDGPRVTALGNLSGVHQDLFNLEDARRLGEEALKEARHHGMRQMVTVVGANLVFTCHALGDLAGARAMAGFLLEHPDETLPHLAQTIPLSLALGHLASGEIEQALHFLGEETNSGPALGDGDAYYGYAWMRARCRLARANPKGARDLLERTLNLHADSRPAISPYHAMQVGQAMAQACEQLADLRAALDWQREEHSHHVQLLGRGAQARQLALELARQSHDARRERDRPGMSERLADSDRLRLVELNEALQAKIAETELLHVALREQAVRDPHTGLHNRNYLFEAGPALLDLAGRQQHQACVVLLDMDHFKLLNDTYGHRAGDQVLKRFATLMQHSLRQTDILCRYGGEQFVALMPGMDGEEAMTLLAGVQASLRALEPEPGRRRAPSGSFSAGVAVFPQHGMTLEKLLHRADKALSLAKQMGRARVEIATDPGLNTLS